MEEYLNSLPSLLEELKNNISKDIIVVMGNESCDMDSAVCAVTLAHHLSSASLALPCLNIPKEDVALRTEVIYSVGAGFMDKIPCRDDWDLLKLNSSHINLILVDHHVLLKRDSFLQPKISQIIDHRQIAADISGCSNARIELVASCATLVAEQLLKEGYTVSVLN